MKKNNIVLYVILALAVLVIVSGVLYLYTSSSRTIDALQKGIVERDSLITGRDNTITGLRDEIAGLRSAKDDLARRLDGETLAKEAVRANLDTLEWQLKDAMMVEGALTTALDKASTEAEGLRVRISEELNSKMLVLDELRRTKDRLSVESNSRIATIDLLIAERADNKKLSEWLSASVSERADMMIRLDTAKKLIQGTLIQTVGQPKISSKTVKSVVLIPADIKISIGELDQLKPAIEKACTINQLWFFVQTEEAFSCEKPVVIRGEKSLKWYDNLAPDHRIYEIRKEIGAFY